MRCRVCIAFSAGDAAGSGAAKALCEMFHHSAASTPRAVEAYFLPDLNALLTGFREDVLYLEFLDDLCDAEFYIILSRHSSEARIKALTVHHPGNPMREAAAGGRPLELPPSNPPITRLLLLSLHRLAEELPEFKVSYEVTHHGPTSLRRPVTFVEIGSSSSEWGIRRAHEVLAEAVAAALASHLEGYEAVVGVGGNHYASAFTSQALTTPEAYGHMLANYALKSLDDPQLVKEVVKRAVEKSAVPTQKIVAERKLRSAWRSAIEEAAAEEGVGVEYI